MPVKRRVPKTRIHDAVKLTPARLKFLVVGQWFYRKAKFGDDAPFGAREEAELCWRANREEIMQGCSEKYFTGSFPPGTRPWGFWRFDQNRPVPIHQAIELEKLGLLSPQERAITITLARAAWTLHTSGFYPEPKARAALITDEQLLQMWPNFWSAEPFTQGETK